MGDSMMPNRSLLFLSFFASIAAPIAFGDAAFAQERVFVTDRGGATLKVLDTSMMPSMTSVDVGVEPVNVAVQPGGAFA